MLGLAMLITGIPADTFTPRAMASDASAIHGPGSCENDSKSLNRVIDKSIFPDNYPRFLKQAYTLLRQTEYLKQLSRQLSCRIFTAPFMT